MGGRHAATTRVLCRCALSRAFFEERERLLLSLTSPSAAAPIERGFLVVGGGREREILLLLGWWVWVGHTHRDFKEKSVVLAVAHPSLGALAPRPWM